LKVARLTISNFRGIKSTELLFDGHSLIIGNNNVGKSTICEALDLVLGRDRLNRFPPVEEFDFYNCQYLTEATVDNPVQTSIPIRIEVVLIQLDEEIENRCGGNIEFWHTNERRVLNQGEVEAANPPDVISCLRVETIAAYDAEEDEFEAKTYFSHSPNAEEGQLTPIRRDIRNLFGFLYLRTLRTGSRALSLERGSLLDIILRLKNVRTGLWEKSINRLRDLDIEKDATVLEPVLKSIAERLTRYIPSDANDRATKLHVTQLTREHLRKTLAFFLSMSKDQSPVPFQLAGTGTLNTLVLALLSFIADLKPTTVIFAMEEPEIAVPPHTQRRIADYLLTKTSQAFVTSHSPYIIERFTPSQTLLLSREAEGKITYKRLSDASGLKDNDYKRYARRGLTECMLGKAAIVVEGLTEFHALPVAARKLEAADPNLQPLDISGVVFFDAESDGSMPKFGTFFKALNLKTFSFYDFKKRKPEDKQKFTDSFDVDFEHNYAGFEALIVAEMPLDRLWGFLSEVRDSSENLGIPPERPSDDEIKDIAMAILRSNKGAGLAAKLFDDCLLEELPPTIVYFLTQIYSAFPKPVELALEDEKIPEANEVEPPAPPAAD
jgi:putative ATP-dependent endonuclease of OLD family